MKDRLIRITAVTTFGLASLGALSTAHAGPSASFTASSMYLWRGQTLSGAGPAISGDLYYTTDLGIYGGIWTSSEGISGSHETDLNVGFAKKFGMFGVDVGIFEYWYPEVDDPASDDDALMDTDAREWYVGGSVGPVSAKILVNPEDVDSKYITIDGGFGKFGAHIGITQKADSDDEYNDISVSYMPAENLTFLISKATGDGVEGAEDPLFVVSYKWAFEVK